MILNLIWRSAYAGTADQAETGHIRRLEGARSSHGNGGVRVRPRVPARGKEVTAYEFLCEYEGERYFVYIDADTGEEVMILSVLLSGQGQMIL